jgi:hypothetical protein
MSRITVSLEVDSPVQESLIRKYHAFLQEMEQLALAAPDGHVLDACEAAVLQKGQEVNRQVLQQAVQKRISAMEKKGRRFEHAPAVAHAPIAASLREKS